MSQVLANIASDSAKAVVSVGGKVPREFRRRSPSCNLVLSSISLPRLFYRLSSSRQSLGVLSHDL